MLACVYCVIRVCVLTMRIHLVIVHVIQLQKKACHRSLGDDDAFA